MLSDSFYGRIISGIQEVLIGADYSVTVIGARNTRLGTLMTPEEACARAVDGYITLTLMNPEYMARLVKCGIPIVGAEFHFEAEAPTDYVVQDCEQIAWELTRKLLELGHRRIAFFGHATRNINPVSCPDQNSLERLAGIRRAFQGANISPSEDLFFQPPHPQWSSTEALFQQIFSRPLPPTAVFCEGPEAVAEVSAFLARQGREPRDYPAFTIASTDGASGVGRRCWQVIEDWTEFGRLAARRMLQRIEKPDLPPETIKLPWRLEPPDAAIRGTH